MVPWTLLFLSAPPWYLEVYLKSDGTSFSKSRSSVKEHIWILCFILCQDHFNFPEACIKCSYLSNGRWDHVIPDLRFLDNAHTLGQQKLTVVKPSTKYLHRMFTYAWELWGCMGILLSRESPCFYKLTLFTWLSSQLKFLILQCLLETFHKGLWFSHSLYYFTYYSVTLCTGRVYTQRNHYTCFCKFLGPGCLFIKCYSDSCLWVIDNVMFSDNCRRASFPCVLSWV